MKKSKAKKKATSAPKKSKSTKLVQAFKAKKVEEPRMQVEISSGPIAAPERKIGAPAILGAPYASEQKAHSKIGASSMHIWSECPGSVKMSEGMPEVVSPYAKEGTIAHEIAEQIINKKLTVEQAQLRILTDGLADDLLPAVLTYVDYIKTRAIGADKVLIEHRFDLSKIHPGLFGTADCVLYFADKKKLVVIDYKHGAGIPVTPHENPQLMYYGLGALLSLNLPCKEIELVIVQPRVIRKLANEKYAPQTYDLFAHELIDFAGKLELFAKATEKENAPVKEGEHCRFCKGAAKCPAIAEKALKTAQEQFRPQVSYDPKRLAEVLRQVPYLRTWLKNVEDFALSQAQSGQTIPGFKLVAKRSVRKWSDVKEVGKALEHYGYGDEIYHDPELKSPAQIEKIITQPEVREKIFADYCLNVSTGENLVPEEDRRQEVQIGAESQFKVVQN